MVLRFAAHIHKRFAQLVGNECSLGDGSCGDAGNSLSLRKVLLDGMTQLDLDECAEVGKREGLAVVTIDG